MRCSARPYPVSAAPNASGRRARTTSGPATVGIAGIHSILADSARTAAISGKSRGVFSVEKCLRTQNGTCSNEDGGDLQSLDPLSTAPDLRFRYGTTGRGSPCRSIEDTHEKSPSAYQHRLDWAANAIGSSNGVLGNLTIPVPFGGVRWTQRHLSTGLSCRSE